LRPDVSVQEIRSLLENIYQRYHYDFRQYAAASLRRRLAQAMTQLQCATLPELQQKVLAEKPVFAQLLEHLTFQVSDLFRDPDFFLAVRRQVIPLLATYPSIKVWVAGCGTGEEAYSFAILLAEAGLLDRTRIYATDINEGSLRKAQSGTYALNRMKQFTMNHHAAGGPGSLSAYYRASDAGAVMEPTLRQHITFADHSLAADSIFAEVQLVSCRNVLIYFARELQDRALGLFDDTLCRRGFLCLGGKESLRFSAKAARFQEWNPQQKIYRRVD
jgi:chemotaxis protein methyltransferase CheR